MSERALTLSPEMPLSERTLIPLLPARLADFSGRIRSTWFLGSPELGMHLALQGRGSLQGFRESSPENSIPSSENSHVESTLPSLGCASHSWSAF